MRMEKIRVQLVGLTPLLMNRLSPEKLKKKTRKQIKAYDQKKEARESAYIAKIGTKEILYIPAEAIFRCLIKTARFFRTGKYSASRILAGSVRVEPEKVPLNKNKYEIDVRPVVVQRARVLRSRAKVSDWRVEFDIVYDTATIEDPELIKEILEEAGIKSGLLDYRPERGGSFGTFSVGKFEVVK